MKGRTPTAEEQRWMNQAVQVGCIACIIVGRIKPFEMPVEYTAMHHIDGKTKPGAHFKTIPLCAADHQTGPYARHKNKRLFEETYDTEDQLLDATRQLVNLRFGVDWPTNKR